MNLLQLGYIVEVAKTGSLLKASQNLHISQPALSKAIIVLEKELNVKIFNRSRLGTTPTLQGKKILEIAYDIISKAQELHAKAKSQSENINENLTISTIQSFMPRLTGPLFNIKEKYPYINIDLKEKGTSEVLEDVAREEVDMGICRMPENLHQQFDNIIFEQLIVGKMNVLVSKHSPLVIKKFVTPEEIKKHDIVLFDSEFFRWFANDFKAKYGPLNILFKSNNRTFIRKVVATGSAIALSMDLLTEREAPDDRFVNLNVVYDRPLNFSIGIALLNYKSLSTASEIFMEDLRNEFKGFNEK